MFVGNVYFYFLGVIDCGMVGVKCTFGRKEKNEIKNGMWQVRIRYKGAGVKIKWRLALMTWLRFMCWSGFFA